MIRIVCLATLITVAAPAFAAEPALILVSEQWNTEPANYWWKCDAPLPAMPVADRLAQALGGAGFKVINRCETGGVRIHKSYHRANLKNFQVSNLGTAMGLRKVIWGKIQLQQRPKNKALSLHHVEATLDITLINPQKERSIGQLSVQAHGFHPNLDSAKSLAGESLVARFLDTMEKLIKPKQAPIQQAVLEVWVEQLERLSDLDNLLLGLRQVRSVKSVKIKELSHTLSILQIQPNSAAEAVLLHLQNQPFTTTLKQPGKADIHVEPIDAVEETDTSKTGRADDAKTEHQSDPTP
ncbi:MAG TPA: hypothetical protein EYN06_02690 [Myxococcales bacterium]|nr:hypothetical protein [Myxococcales bacterium]HIN85361.1 hypothetical protein [Myxococcales bacterium]